MRTLSDEEMKNVSGGEALVLASVMTVLATAIVAVIVYRIFTSSKGSSTLPGGWKFTWD